MFSACTGAPPPRESERRRSYTEGEAEFSPSRYREQSAHRADSTDAAVGVGNQVESFTPGARVVQRVMGYKVQLFSSTDIEEARFYQDSLRVMFPSDSVELAYDAPAYKIRIGNFLERKDAEVMKRALQELGWSSAWIVPAMVLKDKPTTLPGPGK